MDNRSPPAKFLNLWPTLLMNDQLPDAQTPNRLLVEEIEQRDAAESNMTTTYRNHNFFESEQPAIGWLRECINQAVIRYLKQTAVDYPLEWHLQGWPNINRFGDYHNLHNHPRAWLSGTYYVAVLSETEPLPGRSDRTPGAISFFHPRPQANMTAIRHDPQVDPEHRVQPAPSHPGIFSNALMSLSIGVEGSLRPAYTLALG